MNEKQVKLMRYFSKATGDIGLAGSAMANWDNMSHKKRGQLTRWMKKVIVTMMHVAKEKKRAALEQNLKTLDGFFRPVIVDERGKALVKG